MKSLLYFIFMILAAFFIAIAAFSLFVLLFAFASKFPAVLIPSLMLGAFVVVYGCIKQEKERERECAEYIRLLRVQSEFQEKRATSKMPKDPSNIIWDDIEIDKRPIKGWKN